MDELISGQSDVVGRLAFKYMEMCKVDSSSDSELETNQRWSDINNKIFINNLTENNYAACKKLQRMSGQNYQQCLDPYDGSSEDSSSCSNKGSNKRQRNVSFKMKGRGRRSANSRRETREGVTQHDVTEVNQSDVQMRSWSDSELESSFCSPCRSVTGLKVELSESGFNSISSINSPAVPSGSENTNQTHAGSPETSSSLHAAFSKRKFFTPSGEAEEGMQRKRPCISDMEVENVTL